MGRVNNRSSSSCRLRLTRCLQAVVLVVAAATLAATAASAAGTRECNRWQAGSLAILWSIVPTAEVKNVWLFETKLAVGTAAVIATAWLLYRRTRPPTTQASPPS